MTVLVHDWVSILNATISKVSGYTVRTMQQVMPIAYMHDRAFHPPNQTSGKKGVPGERTIDLRD